jgi:segregation and condensation protein B
VRQLIETHTKVESAEREPAKVLPLAPSPASAAHQASQAAAAEAPELSAREPQPIPRTVPAEDPDLDEVEPASLEQEGGDEPDTPFDKLEARAKRLSEERVRTLLEALLFVADRPLPEDVLRQATGIEPAVLRGQLEKLQGKLRDGVSGIVLHEVAGGWQLRTDPGSAEYVRRFLKVKPQRLTRAALETMAIVAYRQPVTRPEIEEVRAVDCGAVLKALLERRLVKILGKKEEPGRPLLYGTTREFLEFFNLKDLASLPTLREFQELSEEHRDIVEKETGESTPGPQGTVAALRDSQFEERLRASSAEGDAALDELESALRLADSRARSSAESLDPKPPPSDGSPGERSSDGSQEHQGRAG